MPRRPPPTPPKLKRPSSTIPKGPPPIVVICEGCTEERLLKGLRGRWRIRALQVKVEGGQGDPRNVVQVANDRKRADAKHGVEVWVVFDRDEHHHWSSAIDRAQTLGIGLAVSNPCFELWAILLHREHTSCIHRREAQRLLKELHKGFDHARTPYLDVDVVLGALELAEQRSEIMLRTALANGDRYANPCTTFSDVVRSIRARASGADA